MAKKEKELNETPLEETVEEVVEETVETPEVNPWEWYPSSRRPELLRSGMPTRASSG